MTTEANMGGVHVSICNGKRGRVRQIPPPSPQIKRQGIKISINKSATWDGETNNDWCKKEFPTSLCSTHTLHLSLPSHPIPTPFYPFSHEYILTQSAAHASPAMSARKPHWRPITSTMNVRWWLSAVLEMQRYQCVMCIGYLAELILFAVLLPQGYLSEEDNGNHIGMKRKYPRKYTIHKSLRNKGVDSWNDTL